jgi:alpha-glucosidase
MRSRFLRYGLLISGCLAAIWPAAGQVQNIGPIVSYGKIAGGISGRTASAFFEVRAWDDGIVRVRVSKNPKVREFSYALVSTVPLATPVVSVREQDGRILLVTSLVRVTIDKVPAFRVSFCDSLGRVINEDMGGPGFGTTFIGDKVSVYKRLQEGERFVGLGESLGNLDKRGMGVTLSNMDNYKYGDPRLPMYSSIPFYIGIHHQQVYGLFFHNTYRTFFNFGLSTPDFASINADGGDADYFLCYGKNIGEVLGRYTSLTGRMPLPPLWSLGYHQSRCSYYPQDNVLLIGETFRRKRIPIDCIVLDADYLQDYEPFRINKRRFPDMPGLAARLREMNIELTASVNPGIKLDSSYDANADGLKKDVFLKYADGRPFVSEMAPSLNHYVDFTDPKARSWWIDDLKFLPENGIHGYWNDMNEPAVAGSYLPDNLVFDFDGGRVSSLEGKNVYGMQMARSSYESGLKYGGGRRPFVLTRSAFAGVQRYSALWSGDNQAKDEYLLGGVLLNTQLGLSGLPFVGPDLGGYIGDGNKELYKRWVEVGVFSPFVRNHREFFANAGEPWAYGEEAEAISRSYIGFRYRLMPYIYSKFYETAKTGLPVVRGLCVEEPFDSRVFDAAYQYEFLFGDALLVVPLTSMEKVKRLFLPRGDWYDCWSDSVLSGNREIIAEYPIYQLPLFIKASSILPMQSLVQSTKERPGDTLQVHFFYGREKNEFVYYEDDGATFAYRDGHYCRRVIRFDPSRREIDFGAQEGDFASAFGHIEVVLHGFPEASEFRPDSRRSADSGFRPGAQRLLDALGGMEDLYDPGLFRSLRSAESPVRTRTRTIANSKERLTISW